MDKNLFISFNVDVRDEQWGGKRYSGQCEITVPRSVLDELDPGNIFQACLKAALVEYDKPDEEAE